MDGRKQSRLRRRLLLGMLMLAIGSEWFFVAYNHYSTEKALANYLKNRGWKEEWRKVYPFRRDWVLLKVPGGVPTARLNISAHFTSIGAKARLRVRRSIERKLAFTDPPTLGDEVRLFHTGEGFPHSGKQGGYIFFRNGRYLVEVRSDHLSLAEVTAIAGELDGMVEEAVPFRFLGYPFEGGFIEAAILRSSFMPRLPFQ